MQVGGDPIFCKIIALHDLGIALTLLMWAQGILTILHDNDPWCLILHTLAARYEWEDALIFFEWMTDIVQCMSAIK